MDDVVTLQSGPLDGLNRDWSWVTQPVVDVVCVCGCENPLCTDTARYRADGRFVEVVCDHPERGRS